ncbi:mitochondrial 37S ribosomal protein nam9 [Myotisia sp. PD_48]|nr:mitochondrial 37S ribosomal protein nam9 [Myotisia sp. PD_48]
MRNRATNYLRKAKVRQSWNKFNLYNLSRIRLPSTQSKTFFQQKWGAKSIARAYHGEQVREGQWEKMFSRRLHAVVPMDARYLANNDGSVESAGRGSGLDKPDGGQNQKQKNMRPIPYMQMTFAPLERRLDVAIFRSLFASSARQARQFVLHGEVTVNGRKMKYPGYLLNPGDMFQVNPERVMYATGAPKDDKERRAGRVRRRMKKAPESSGSTESTEASAKKEEAEPETPEDHRETLKLMLSRAKGMLTANKDVLPAQRKQDVRAFQQAIRRVLSRSTTSTVLTDNLEAQFLELKAIMEKEAKKARETATAPTQSTSSSTTSEPTTTSSSSPPPQSLTQDQIISSSSPSKNKGDVDVLAQTLQNTSLSNEDLFDLSDKELDALKRALAQLYDNPIDSTKPYATPWRPREYMSAFAFIPRYLEVNHNICAAVYLRHPVARPGLAEVPSPYGESIGGPAFVWYLRRR